MRSLKAKVTYLLALVFLSSCGSYNTFRNDATADYSAEKKKKYTKYMIQGKILYTTYCSNCHQADGTGLGRVYPPLKQADYMLADVKRTMCLIKNGMEGEIVVNGISYNQKMAGVKELTNLEIAEITTYINNSWGNANGMVELQEVDEALKNCQ